jgi:uncharacterized protein
MRAAVFVCLWLAAAPAGAIPQRSIADPRPGSAVVDTTGTLAPGDLAAVDTAADRARDGGELMVVVIDSVGGAVPRTFTTELFNRWGLDGRERNRGVMLLVALKDRKAEIVVGDGYPDSVTSVTDRIMRDTVVARFKAGRPREAIVEGARAIVDQVILRSRSGVTSTVAPPVANFRRPPPATAAPEGFLARLAYGAMDHPLPVGGALGGAVAGGALLRRHLRNRPRPCPACRTMMTRLQEIADDAHLTSGEKAEERVGSVDYDVWACSCGQTRKLRYGSLFTSYGKCRSCQAKTLKVTTTTVVSATTSSEGRARVDERCAHCSYTNTYHRSIPRIQRSSSSSSSSRGSSSGRGSSGSW